MSMIDRRQWLFATCAALTAAAKPVVLLRSGWQTENIGDIAHTPGVLHLLQQHLPDVRVILWCNALGEGVGEMLRRNFPKVRLVSGEPESAPVQGAFREASFFLHGSGPSVVARSHLEAWRRQTHKPYGIFGVTITTRREAASREIDAGLRELLEGAAFVFTRETKSLQNLRDAGVRAKDLRFVPDGTFSFSLADEAGAAELMREASLEPGRFIAVIPRLRYTPYHQMRKVAWSEEEIRRRTSANEAHAEADHAKLREAIIAWVRKTGNRALLCPEMTYELDILRPLLYDPLPAGVKTHVALRGEYWLPDKAASVYRRAAAVIGFECHSPILAAAQGTPCMYIHQPEDGIKGQMWRDVGLGDWYFEVEETPASRIAETLLAMTGDREASRRKVRAAVNRAQALQKEGMTSLGPVMRG